LAACAASGSWISVMRVIFTSAAPCRSASALDLRIAHRA
jgi:hypothetical protein